MAERPVQEKRYRGSVLSPEEIVRLRKLGNNSYDQDQNDDNVAKDSNSKALVKIDPAPALIYGRYTIKYFLAIIITLISVFGFPYAANVVDRLTAPREHDYARRVDRILSRVPLIDGHNDLPYLITVELQNKIYQDRFTFRQGLLSNTDLVKLRKGRVGGQFWSCFNECQNSTNPNDQSNVVRNGLETIDVARRFIQEYSDIFEFCTDSSCPLKAFYKGKIASMLGVEGGHITGNTLAAVRQFYELGVRYITLTHNCDNAYATSGVNASALGYDNGLTKFGVQAVKEMNRLGMMVDLSHTSANTMRHAISVSRAPVIFSHALAQGLSDSWRNVPDDVVRLVGKTGGIIMATFVCRFLRNDDPSLASIDDAVNHILYLADLAGWDHVGIGSDFDGTPLLPQGLEDVSKYPNLFIKLMEKGATDEQLKKLAGENILRVWAEVEQVSDTLRLSEKPVEDSFPGRIWSRAVSGLPFMFYDSRKTRTHSYDQDGNFVY